MALPLGLIAKSLVGVVSVGGIGTGTWIFFAKGSWTQLDKDVFEASGTWTWTPTSDSTITAGTDQKIEITGTLTTTGSNTSKTWKCTILGKLPKTLETNAASKVSEQLNTLKTAIGVGSNGTWQPNNSTEATKKAAAEKFFSSCIKNRTLAQWSEARKGSKGESVIHLEIVKDGTNNNYKFDEKEFKKLYSDETT